MRRVGAICTAEMPVAGTRCARSHGHLGSHRSRVTLDRTSARVVGRPPDPYVYRDGRWLVRATLELAS